MTKVNSGLTGPKFIKFSHHVARSSPLLRADRHCDIPIRFGVTATNEGEVANLAPKLVAMATSLERSEKEGQIDQIPTIR